MTIINPITQICDAMSSIYDDSIRSWTMSMMAHAPQAFWDKAASSTGRYHKEDENCQYGQVIHTLRVIAVAEHLARMIDLNDLEADILLSSACLHDICKYGVDGESEYSLSEHPLLVKRFWELNLLMLPLCNHAKEIIDTVIQHSGRWTGLPHPTFTKLGKLLHTADFIASRRNIMVDINIEMEY